MAMDKTMIANHYGNALFEVAKDQNDLAAIAKELDQLQTILKAQPKLMAFMTSPQIKVEAQQTVIAALKKDASPLVTNLIQMTYDYHRFELLNQIISEFNKLYDEERQIVHITVITVSKLDEDQKQRLATVFAKRLGAKRVMINEEIDPSIIGGVVLKSNSRIYDGSIKTKLEKIKRMLIKK